MKTILKDVPYLKPDEKDVEYLKNYLKKKLN
jgi:hypothetical protein